MIRPLALIGFVLACLSFSAGAQTNVHYAAGQRVDPSEVARILGAPAPTGVKTRSLRLLDSPATAEAVGSPSSLSIPVRFAFDSADILPEARSQLDAVAEGIKQLPSTRSVIVEGHTDATGSDGYNLDLSKRRAAAVRNYLVRVHGIEESRLQHLGLGKLQPIDGTDPFAPQNRRVQFRGG
jgi:outer membrane protein OmpA-like peptidoglycan-associated protein